MAGPAGDPAFRRLMAELNIEDSFADHLISLGYDDGPTFSYSFVNVDAFEEFLRSLFEDQGWAARLGLDPSGYGSSPIAGKLRRLWNLAADAPNTSPGQASGPALFQPSEWAEVLPPKLRPEQIREMTAAFEKNYVGEHLTDAVMPGTRYLSTVWAMLRPGAELRWIPWTQTLSRAQEASVLESRASRRGANSDLSALLRLTDSEPPAIPESDLRGSHSRIQQLFEVRRTAFALCQACHLATHKAYDHVVMTAFTRDWSGDPSLRGPNLQELLNADRTLLDEVYKLVNSKEWDMDQALHEMSRVRNDVAILLMPRPRPATPPPPQRIMYVPDPPPSRRWPTPWPPAGAPKRGREGARQADRKIPGSQRPRARPRQGQRRPPRPQPQLPGPGWLGFLLAPYGVGRQPVLQALERRHLSLARVPFPSQVSCAQGQWRAVHGPAPRGRPSHGPHSTPLGTSPTGALAGAGG